LGSLAAVMNDWSRTWFAGEESLQTVKDIVPGVIGLRGNSREQDNSKRRPQAKARQKASVKTHSYNPSSVFCPTLSKRTNLVSQKLEFLGLSGACLFLLSRISFTLVCDLVCPGWP
jgi:hypothetical protein